MKKEKKSEQLRLRLTKDEKYLIQKMAEKRNMNMTELLVMLTKEENDRRYRSLLSAKGGAVMPDDGVF